MFCILFDLGCHNSYPAQDMEIKLAKIQYQHFHDVIDLEVEKSQEKNLPSNLCSIAEASFSSNYHKMQPQ